MLHLIHCFYIMSLIDLIGGRILHRLHGTRVGAVHVLGFLRLQLFSMRVTELSVTSPF